MTDRPLRVGLVVDGPEPPAWSALVAEELARAPEVELHTLVSIEGPASYPRVGLLWRLYRHADRAIVGRIGDLLDPHTPVDLALPSSSCRRVVVDLTDTTKSGASAAARALGGHDLDLVLNLSSRLPSDDLVTAADLGVWFCSQGAGDDRVSDWSIIVLQELYRDHAVIPTALARIPGRGLGAEVVSRMWSAVNRHSLYRTEARLLWKTAAFLGDRVRRVARDLTAGGKVEALSGNRVEAEPRVANRHFVIFLVKLLTRLLRRGARRLLYRDSWTIGIRRRRGPGVVDYSAVDGHGFIPVPSWAGGFLADPFVWEASGKSYVFCEQYLDRKKRGVISYLEVEGDRVTGSPRPVLTRPYHMSYPFLCEWRGTIFMLPETRRNRTIELYRCVRFPDQWTLDTVLMEDVLAVDTSLLVTRDRLWMFTTFVQEQSETADELHIFWAEDIRGPWRPHPCNPVVADVRGARSAGAIIAAGSSFIRPSQDGSERYGRRINFNRIVQLSEEAYEEELVGRIEGDWLPSAEGAHTWNCAADLEVIDGAVAEWRWAHLLLHIRLAVTRRLRGRLPNVIVRAQAEEGGEGLRARVPIVYVLGALVGGGAEKQLLLLLESLDRRRFAPHVIAFEPGAWEGRFRARAVSVDVIGFKNGRTRALFRCWRRLRQLSPTIVHTVGRTANYIGRLAAVAAGVPVIVMSERSAAFIRSPLMIRLDRLLAPFTTHVISNSHHAATFLHDKGIAPRGGLSVVVNGIAASQCRPSTRERLGLEIGNIGGLRLEKNQVDLLHALASVTKEIPAAMLRIAGDGPLRASLQALAVDLGVATRVRLCGWVEDVAKFLGGVDVYVHCSQYEGLPNALMEAMACGLPCVAYDTTGCHELIEHMKTGILVARGNHQGLADAILRLARDQDLARALGTAAHSAIVEGFTVERMVEKTCAVYESTLRGASGDG